MEGKEYEDEETVEHRTGPASYHGHARRLRRIHADRINCDGPLRVTLALTAATGIVIDSDRGGARARLFF